MPWALDFLLGGESIKTFVVNKMSLVNGVRCVYPSEGRKAEDPFRGLRAGPASFPRPLPSHSYISCGLKTAGASSFAEVFGLLRLLFSAKSNPFKNACEEKFHSRLQSTDGWGVVQLVGHLTVNAHEAVPHARAPRSRKAKITNVYAASVSILARSVPRRHASNGRTN